MKSIEKIDGEWKKLTYERVSASKLCLGILVLVLMGSLGSEAQTLSEYQQFAAENNPGLQAKYKAFEASMERVSQVSSLPDPTISFGYFISPVETRVGPQRARFSLTQMFPWFGTLKTKEDAAVLQAEARYQEFLDAKNQLFYQVADAYYPLYELAEFQEIEQENIRILESYKNIATQKFENGSGPMVDVLRVDIMLSDAQTNLKILELQKESLYSRFNNLLNRAEQDSIHFPDILIFPDPTIDTRKDSLLVDHPQLLELDVKIEASGVQERAARKSGLPNIGAGLDYVIVDERSDMSIPDNGKDVIMPMISLSIPLFRGKYKGAVREAQLMQESYQLQKEEKSNNLTTNYEKVSFAISKQRALLQLYDDQIATSEQSLNLLLSSYQNEGKDFEEVLNMQQELLKYYKLHIEAAVQLHISLAELDYITAKTR